MGKGSRGDNMADTENTIAGKIASVMLAMGVVGGIMRSCNFAGEKPPRPPTGQTTAEREQAKLEQRMEMRRLAGPPRTPVGTTQP